MSCAVHIMATWMHDSFLTELVGGSDAKVMALVMSIRVSRGRFSDYCINLSSTKHPCGKASPSILLLCIFKDFDE